MCCSASSTLAFCRWATPVTLPASSFSSHLEAHSGRFLAKGNAHMEYCLAAFRPQADVIVVALDLLQGVSDSFVHLLYRGCAFELQHSRTPVFAVPDNDVVQALSRLAIGDGIAILHCEEAKHHSVIIGFLCVMETRSHKQRG